MQNNVIDRCNKALFYVISKILGILCMASVLFIIGGVIIGIRSTVFIEREMWIVNECYCQLDFLLSEHYMSCMSSVISLVSVTNIVLSFIYDKSQKYKYGLSIYQFLDAMFFRHFIFMLRFLSIVAILFCLACMALEWRRAFCATFVACIVWTTTLLLSWGMVISDTCIDVLIDQMIRKSIWRNSTDMKFVLKSQEDYSKHENLILVQISCTGSYDEILRVYKKYVKHLKLKSEIWMEQNKSPNVVLFQMFDYTYRICIRNHTLDSQRESDFKELINATVQTFLDSSYEYVRAALIGFLLGIMKSENPHALEIIKKKVIEENDWFFFQSALFVLGEGQSCDQTAYESQAKFISDMYGAGKHLMPNWDKIVECIGNNKDLLKECMRFMRCIDLCDFYEYEAVPEYLCRDMDRYFDLDDNLRTNTMRCFRLV